MLVAALGGIYIVSQFLRNSVGVIAPNLASELGLSASEIGLLASVFFFSFAAAQIPLGVALDRYGPRRCMLVCAAIAILGTLMFALAASPFWLIAARVLMGLGSSCYLMAPLALYAKRYPPDRFATLVGLQIGLGTLGTLLATAPFAFAVAVDRLAHEFRRDRGARAGRGRCWSQWWCRTTADDRPRTRETLRDSLRGTLEATRVPSFWPVFAMQCAGYSSFVIVVGLWGGPYLTHIYGFSLTERGNMLFVAVVAQVVGSLLWGTSDRLFSSYKVPVLIGAASDRGRHGTGGLDRGVPAVRAAALVHRDRIVYRRAVGPDRARQVAVSAEMVGRGMTLMNIGTMGGVFVSQTITGFIIDLFPHSERRVCTGCISCGFRFPGRRYPIGFVDLFVFHRSAAKSPVWG